MSEAFIEGCSVGSVKGHFLATGSLLFAACLALLSAGRTKAVDTIAWNADSLVLIEKNAGYGRMIRLSSGEILCCYDRGGQVWAEASSGNAGEWDGQPVLIAKSECGIATNPEILELSDGTIMCCFNERPNDGHSAFAILTCFSNTKGSSWSEPTYAYKAGSQFQNGCWEPAALQLPSGEVQVYFANEGPYRQSQEQEISLLRSFDNGKTWGAASRISFREGHRDGMPVPVLLSMGPKGIAVAIEDSGLDGGFKPVILYSALVDNWTKAFVSGEAATRWSALRTPLKPQQIGAAPYLRQMPSGKTVLSFQLNDSSRREPRMVVYVGNEWCRNFQGPSIPFPVAPNVACLWNSLCVMSEDQVTALSGTTIDGVLGLWAIDGALQVASGQQESAATLVAVWQHRVDDGPATTIELYSDGSIGHSAGRASWAVKGRELTMSWPNARAPGGAWRDRCVLADDRSSYSGMNQNGNKISGKLSQALGSFIREAN